MDWSAFLLVSFFCQRDYRIGRNGGCTTLTLKTCYNGMRIKQWRCCFAYCSWALEAISHLPPGFWRSAMSLEVCLSFFEKRMVFSDNTDCSEVQSSLRSLSRDTKTIKEMGISRR